MGVLATVRSALIADRARPVVSGFAHSTDDGAGSEDGVHPLLVDELKIDRSFVLGMTTAHRTSRW